MWIFQIRCILTSAAITPYYVIQMCSGIARGRVLNAELCAQRFQKLIYLHVFTDCFMKISPQSSEQIY